MHIESNRPPSWLDIPIATPSTILYYDTALRSLYGVRSCKFAHRGVSMTTVTTLTTTARTTLNVTTTTTATITNTTPNPQSFDCRSRSRQEGRKNIINHHHHHQQRRRRRRQQLTKLRSSFRGLGKLVMEYV